MDKIIEEYLLNNSIEQITKDWKTVQRERKLDLKEWFSFIKELENDGDEPAVYIHSLALRELCKNMTDRNSDNYSEEMFSKIKKFVIDSIKYDIKHTRGEEKEFYQNINLKKYFLID